jgi:hypothetical protein
MSSTVTALPAAPKAIARTKRPRIIYMLPDGAPMGKQLDLVAAVAWKGGKYSTISANKVLQPLLGYSTFIEGGTRYFPRESVEEWLTVNDDNRAEYIRRLLETATPIFRVYILGTLSHAAEKDRLSPGLREVCVELVKASRGVA